MQKIHNSTNKEKIGESYSKVPDLVKKTILGVGVTDDTKENILKYIVNSVKNSAKPYYVVTPNPEMIVLASKNSDFQRILNNAKIATNDGVGVSLAARIMDKPLKGRLTGVELVEKLCEKVNDWPITVGFLGAGPKIAEMASECLKRQYPNLMVTFVGQEWGKEGFDLARKYQVSSIKYQEKKNPKILNTKYVIHTTKVDILFVAFGAPKQEFWMAEHVGKIPATVLIGVGGAFDQIVHSSLRPPQLVQNIGLGWLYRLIRQPWRLRRQLALVKFIGMVIRMKR